MPGVHSKRFLRYMDSVSDQRVEHSRVSQTVRDVFESEIFGKLHENPGLLDRLYVPHRAKTYADKQFVAAILNIPTPELEEHERRHTRPTELIDHLSTFASQQFRLIFLLGPIGRGKTTFLHYQLKVHLPSVFPTFTWKAVIIDILKLRTEKTISQYRDRIQSGLSTAIESIYEDFRDRTRRGLAGAHAIKCEIFGDDLFNAGLPAEPADREVDRDLYDEQRAIIGKIKRSDWTEYYRRILEYEKKKEPDKRIILAIDNMDQHLPYQEKRMQFIIEAHAIALDLGIPLIVTMRDSTYRVNNPDNLMSTFDSAQFLTIEPIPVEQILPPRLKLANAELRRKFPDPSHPGRQLLEILSNEFSLDEALDSEDVELVKNFQETYLWMNALPNKNIRSALELLRASLQAGFLTKDIDKEGGFEDPEVAILANEIIRLKQGLHVNKYKRALLLRDSRYFDEKSSSWAIINLFDAGVPDWRCNHIIRVKVLQFLAKHTGNGILCEEALNIVKNALGPGAHDYVAMMFRVFSEKGLLYINLTQETDHASEYVVSTPVDIEKYKECFIALTSNGRFHLNNLIYDTIYLDEMKFSTFIEDDAYAQIFREFAPGQEQPSYEGRIDSTILFLQYLRNEEVLHPGIGRVLDVPDVFQDIYDHYRAVANRMHPKLKRSLKE